jgi:hypothetical protein
MHVLIFNGFNFSNWCEQVQFHLGVLDLDLAFEVEKHAAIIGTSSAEEKSFHKAWERSNILSLMFMRMSITNNIKSTLPKTKSAKEFMTFVENCSQIIDKSLTGTLMSTLSTIKFDDSRIMHEHSFKLQILQQDLSY